jgi:hypothetical protein
MMSNFCMYICGQDYSSIYYVKFLLYNGCYHVHGLTKKMYAINTVEERKGAGRPGRRITAQGAGMSFRHANPPWHAEVDCHWAKTGKTLALERFWGQILNCNPKEGNCRGGNRKEGKYLNIPSFWVANGKILFLWVANDKSFDLLLDQLFLYEWWVLASLNSFTSGLLSSALVGGFFFGSVTCIYWVMVSIDAKISCPLYVLLKSQANA